MLCEDCSKHFDSKTSRKEEYLHLKRSALQRLKDSKISALPGVQEFEKNLETFCSALEAGLDSQLPCPWYLGDLSWLPPEMAELKVDLDIWDEPRQMHDIIKSASEGCELCIRLCAVTRAFETFGDPAEFELESWVELQAISLKPIRLRFLVQGVTTMKHDWVEMEIEIRNSNTAAQPELITPRGTSSSDSSSIDFLLQSLETCTILHSSCRQKPSNQWLPTRLIDVSPWPTKSDSFKLVDRDELQVGIPHKKLDYLTLSHFWGDQEFLTLKQDNLQSFKRGLPISCLRRSFQDAIAVTRRLQIQYLWIDSLCIVQDLLDDWQAEASLMGMVYMHGLCNLAACSSTDQSLGIFSSRNPTFGGPFRLDWSWSNYTAELSLFYDWFNTLNAHTPLNTRGWVYQERLLSPRTMHFLNFPFWECREMLACEAYPNKSYAETYDWLLGGNKIHDSQHLKGIHGRRFWNNIISEYTCCEFTKEGDKLIALCGIAKISSRFLGTEYLAGLWRQDLLEGLLWQVSKYITGNDSDTIRSEDYIAPSWSWASVDGPIQPFRATVSLPLAEVLSVWTTSATQDQFGEIVGGELKLKCVFFKVPNLRLYVDERDSTFGDWVDYDDWAFSFDDCGEEFYDIETYFLPLAQSHDASRKEGLVICGILVQKDSDYKEQPAFVRVGFAIVSSSGNIANSGLYCDQWVSLPWPDAIFQTALII